MVMTQSKKSRTQGTVETQTRLIALISPLTQSVHYTTLHPFDDIFSRTTRVSRYQKAKTSLDLNEARDDGVCGQQLHQLDNMQTICTSLQTDNHASTPPHTHTQLFNGLLSVTTRAGRYQKKHSPTHTHPDHRTSFISFLHLQRSMASSLFILRA